MKRIPAIPVFIAACLVLSVAAFSKPLLAEEGDRGEEGFSAYSVARLKLFEGTAWVRMPDSGEWDEFTTNSPIPERSRINIPEGSEAEIQFHGGQFVLLTGGTEIDVRKFDEEESVFRLRSGEIRFDLPPEDFSPTRVTIPDGGKVSLPVPGRYWLIAQEDGRTRLVVRSGEAVVTLEGEDVRVRPGEAAMIGQDVRITAYAGPDRENYEGPPPLSEEEMKLDAPPATVRELRDYGEWVYTRDYGYVWRPRVADGWTPYYYGRWVWIFPFGWTWLSYEPWGWYPYHYGWWVTDPVFGWVWSPYRSFVSVNLTFGRFNVRHFHRGVRFVPGNVRFVRDGGNVRWIPLRPGERFVRSGFGRSEPRLLRWEKPLERNAVFVRSGGTRGKAEWRDWSVRQTGRRDVVVGPRGERGGQPPPGVVAPRRDRGPAGRPRTDSVQPERRTPRAEQRSQPERKKAVRTPDTAPSVRPDKSEPKNAESKPADREEQVKTKRSGATEKAEPKSRADTTPSRIQQRREQPPSRPSPEDGDSGPDGKRSNRSR